MDASRKTTLGRPRATALSRENLQRKVDELGAKQEWVHDIELPDGVRTCPDTSRGPRIAPTEKWARLASVVDALELNGKRVLDIGCNEGFYSLEGARRGANVVGVDIDPLRIEKAVFAANALGERNVTYDTIDIYGDAFADLGGFDVCFALGFVHRLPDPYRALARIVERAPITLFEWQAFRFGSWHETFAYYTPRENKPGNYFNPTFWRLSPACMVAVLRNLGYDRFRLLDDGRLTRIVLLAGRADHPAFTAKRGDIRAPPRLPTMARATREYLAAMRRAIRGR